MPAFKISPATAAAVLLCALASAAALVFSGSTRAADEPKAPAARPALTISTAVPQRLVLPRQLAANGSVAAWQEAIIGAQGNGLRLTQVRAHVGDVVRAGQVLATFADDTLQAELAQSRASLLEAQALAAEAAGNVQRARTLQGTGAMSQQQIEQYSTAERTAQARVAVAQAQLQAQQVRLQYTRVLAPDSGVISARTATVGAVVGAGSELFRMVRQGRLEWRAEVTSSELAQLKPGMKAQLATASGDSVQGTVRVLAPTVDPQTRNALVYVDVPAHPQLRAGMFARGEFALGSSEALTVPQEALVARDGFSYVFVLGPEQRVQQRKVQTGRRLGERVELLSGLEGQATVAVRGAGFLNDGDLVRVSNPAVPASTSGVHDLKQKVPLAQINQGLSAIN